VSAALGLAGWPSVAESLMVERDLSLAAYEARPVHLQHLSARASVDAVRRARAAGVRVSAEASPHHLCATDDAPHARHEKDVPFEEAPFGVTGLETAFGALNTFLVRTGEIPLATLLERLSAGRARARPARAAHRRRGARQPRAARPRGGVDRPRGGLPLPLGELVAPRPDPRRSGRQDGRRRSGGVRVVSSRGHGYVLL